jgi:hypothetical protein
MVKAIGTWTGEARGGLRCRLIEGGGELLTGFFFLLKSQENGIKKVVFIVVL